METILGKTLMIIALYILGVFVSSFIVVSSVDKQDKLKEYKSRIEKWKRLDEKEQAKLTLCLYGSWLTVVFVIITKFFVGIKEILESIKILLK